MVENREGLELPAEGGRRTEEGLVGSGQVCLYIGFITSGCEGFVGVSTFSVEYWVFIFSSGWDEIREGVRDGYIVGAHVRAGEGLGSKISA